MTEFSLLVHVSTNTRMCAPFHPCGGKRCDRGVPVAVLRSGAHLTIRVAGQGLPREEATHQLRTTAGGAPEGPFTMARGRRILGGWGGGLTIRAGGEETVHIITVSSGMEREREKQSKGAITMKSKGGERGDVVRFKTPVTAMGEGGGKEHRHVIVASHG